MIKTTYRVKGCWEGLCVVVVFKRGKLVFPNGEAFAYRWEGSDEDLECRIVEGPHRGLYYAERISSTI